MLRFLAMPPKGENKRKIEAKAKASPAKTVKTEETVEEKLAKCNQEYFVELSKRLDVINDEWPDLKSLDPMSEEDGGYLAPLNADAYNKRYAEEEQMEMLGAINFMWQDLKGSVMPHVPIYKERVLELAEAVTPSMPKKALVLAADFDDANKLPRGGLTRLSPDEQPHVVVFKVSDRLMAKCDEEEKRGK